MEKKSTEEFCRNFYNEIPDTSSTDIDATRPKSSEVLPYDLVPPVLFEEVARRFALGLKKYGRDNWRKGLADPDYLRDRANHAMQHLLNYMHNLNNGEDFAIENLAAVGWAVAVLLEAERRKRQDGINNVRKS